MFKLVFHLVNVYAVILAKGYATSAWTLGNDDTASINSPNCDVVQHLDDVFVNCTDRFLQTVPKLPKSSTFINLDRNNISHIIDLPFVGMTHLQSLNLSCNPLKYISKDLFKGLWNLQRIYFLHCLLGYQIDLDYGYLLSDIKTLNEFALTFDNNYYLYNGCSLPNSTYSPFTSIERATVLEISALVMYSLCDSSGHFTIANTKQLTLWNDWVECRIETLKMSLFSGFPGLEELTIYVNVLAGVFPVYIDQDALFKLDRLLVLKISDRYINFFGKQDQVPLQHTNKDWNLDWNLDLFMHNVSASASALGNLRELRMEGFNYPPKTLYLFNCSFALSGLSQSKSLRTLSLNLNSISLLKCAQISDFMFFASNLEVLKIRENCLSPADLFNILSVKSNLKIIDARLQNMCRVPPIQKKIYTSSKKNLLPIKMYAPTYVYELQELYFSNSPAPSYDWFDIAIFIFNNVTKLELSWLKTLPGKSLTVPAKFFKYWPNLRYLDLSGSKIINIDLRTFDVSKLKTLYLSYNSLEKMGSNLSSVLKQIRTLEELYLTNNGISDLSEDVFSSMKLLTTLDLSGNLLSKFKPSLKHLSLLKFVNVSNNRLNQLSSKTRNDLDSIRQRSSIVVDLTGNRLWCTCHTLAFLKWVVSTKVILHSDDTLSFTTKDDTGVMMKNLKHEITTLESTCQSNTVLIVVCSVGTALCISCLVGALMYKFRWRLRYLYYMANLRVRKSPDKYEQIFDYDAFISYSSDDIVARTGCIKHLENAKGLRLFIHERDFTPGEAIAYNISVGIHSSKKTVFFMSDAFLSSEWCLYEFNIARMEALYAKRQTMLIVLLESTVVSKLPIDIIDVIRSVTYLEYPEHGQEDDVIVFWNKLADNVTGK